jgi:hypothetical protein
MGELARYELVEVKAIQFDNQGPFWPPENATTVHRQAMKGNGYKPERGDIGTLRRF